MRIFLACPKETSSSDEKKVKELLFRHMPNLTDDSVQSSAQAYTESFSRFGSWDQWIKHVATGKNYLTQEPAYSHYICAEKEIGRATSEIVRLALERGKFVYFLSSGGVKRVSGVQTKDAQDWQKGWQLTIVD